MKATLKYILEEYEGEKFYAPHAFSIEDDKDLGYVENYSSIDLGDEDKIKDGEEIEVQIFTVCPDCHDESLKDDCTCWYQKYTPIKIIKAVCKCCGHPI